MAEAGGFSKAALTLHLSQPAFSKSLLIPERQLGLSLIERGSRSRHLAQDGTALYSRAQELFSVERGAEDALQSLRSLDRDVLRLSASTTIATYLLPALLADFRAQYPGVQLPIASANTRDIALVLLERRLDAALVEGPVSHSRIDVRAWRDDELIVIAPPGHALLRGPSPIAIQSLADCAFIRRERGSGIREVADAAFAARGIQARISLTLASTEAVKQSVAAGLGLAISSREAAGDQLAMQKVKEVEFADFRIVRRLSVLHITGREMSPVAVVFEKMRDFDTN